MMKQTDKTDHIEHTNMHTYTLHLRSDKMNNHNLLKFNSRITN